jgi:hypothetical protein
MSEKTIQIVITSAAFHAYGLDDHGIVKEVTRESVRARGRSAYRLTGPASALRYIANVFTDFSDASDMGGGMTASSRRACALAAQTIRAALAEVA